MEALWQDLQKEVEQRLADDQPDEVANLLDTAFVARWSDENTRPEPVDAARQRARLAALRPK